MTNGGTMIDVDKLIDDYCDMLIREDAKDGYSNPTPVVIGSLKALLANCLSGNPTNVLMYMRQRINAS